MNATRTTPDLLPHERPPIAAAAARLFASAAEPRWAERAAYAISCLATPDLHRVVELGLAEQRAMRLGQPLQPQAPAPALRLLATEVEKRVQADDPMTTVVPALSPDRACQLTDNQLTARTDRLEQQREHQREQVAAHNADVERLRVACAAAQPPGPELYEATAALKARLEHLDRVRRAIALGLRIARRERERRAQTAALPA